METAVNGVGPHAMSTHGTAIAVIRVPGELVVAADSRAVNARGVRRATTERVPGIEKTD